MPARTRTCFAIASLFAALAATGCACNPAPVDRNVVISLSEELVGRPVAVSINGAKEEELSIWKTYSVDEFFGPVNQSRPGITREADLQFDAAASERVKVLEPTDPAWARWKERGVTYLVVLALLPPGENGVSGDRAEDPRRLIVPLNACLWADPQAAIRLQVSGNGVTLLSQPLPSPR
jgi:hypothetical protein